MWLIISHLRRTTPSAICYIGASMLPLFLQRFETLLCVVTCLRLAKETGWYQRRGKISPFEFLYSLVFGQGSALALTLNAQAVSLSRTVSRQALDQRFTPAAVEYFKAAFATVLQSTLAWKSDSPHARNLQSQFSAIRIFDSTHCACSDSLAALFPACGGGGGEAGIKVLLGYEYITSQLHPLAVLPGKCTDQGLAEMVCQQVQPGELGLLDKGFHKAKGLRGIAARQAYFIIPWSRSVSVWQIDAAGQRQPLDLAAELKHTLGSCREWSAIHLGQEPDAQLGPVRLLAYRLPEENANRRRASLREKCRTYGRQPTVAALELAGWLILITNAPATKLPLATVGYMYRVRWQIELVFKQWKSVLRIDVLPSQNDSRVQCEVWARLLAALLGFVWHQHLNVACLSAHERELSFSKMAKQLQQQGHSLVRTLFQDRAGLDSHLRQIWHKLLQLARKERQPSRPTTWENLHTHWLDAVIA